MKQETYRLAWEARKRKLWDVMEDDHIFAVKKEDGEPAYVCVMGHLGEYHAFALYQGAEEFSSLYRTERAGFGSLDEIADFENGISQDCIQVCYMNKDEITQEEVLEARKHAKALGIRMTGRHSFVTVERFIPFCNPVMIADDDDEKTVDLVLEACIALSDMLGGKLPEDLGIGSIHEVGKETVPLLAKQEDGTWKMEGEARLPEEKPLQYRAPKKISAKNAAKIRKLKKDGVWESRIFHVPAPIYDREPAYYPPALLTVRTGNGTAMPLEAEQDYDPDAILKSFLSHMQKMGIRPEEIRVMDDWTYGFFEGLCSACGIQLTKVLRTSYLLNAYDSLVEHLTEGGDDEGTDEISTDEILDRLAEISEVAPEAMATMPESLKEVLRILADTDDMPEDKRKMAAKFLKLAEGKK